MSNISCENTSSEAAENKFFLKGEKKDVRNTHFATYLLDKLTTHDPYAVALKHMQTNKNIIYKEMRLRSVKCAAWLRWCNVQPGDIITICPSTSINFYVPFLAGLYIGAIVNIWDARCKLNFDELRRMKPKVVFADKKNVLEMYALMAFLLQENVFPLIVIFQSPESYFTTLDSILCQQSFSQDIFTSKDFTCSSKNNDTDTVVILHTFNVMNVEKNIEIPQSAFLSLINSHVHFIFDPKKYGLLYANLGGYQELCFFVKAIITCVPLIIWWEMDFLLLCRKIERFRILWVYCNSEQIQRWCNFLDDDYGGQICTKLPFMRVFFLYEYHTRLCSVHENLLAVLPNARIIPLYFYPEVGLITHKLYTADLSYVAYANKLNSNTEVAIINEKTGMPVGPKEHGEICCRSLCMMNGYYQENVAAKLLIDQKGWLHTRDLGYYTEEGEIFVIGNVMTSIIIRDQLVHISEIKNFLVHINVALEVVVLPLLEENNTAQLFAYIRKNDAFLNKMPKRYVESIVRQKFGDSYKLGGIRFVKNMIYYPNLQVDIKEYYKIFDRYFRNKDYTL